MDEAGAMQAVDKPSVSVNTPFEEAERMVRGALDRVEHQAGRLITSVERVTRPQDPAAPSEPLTVEREQRSGVTEVLECWATQANAIADRLSSVADRVDL